MSVMNGKDRFARAFKLYKPGDLTYQDWVNVGMALKHEGYSVSDWDTWSRRDFGRYHAGECERKWNTFRGSAEPVTGATIWQMAKENGWVPEYGHELEWDDTIERDDHVVIDKNWIEDQEVREPASWHPAQELIRYLETLFEPGENVGYVVRAGRMRRESMCRRTAETGIGQPAS